MRSGASRFLRRSLAAWMAMSLGVVCLPSAALCIGDDGHLAIEAVGSSCGAAEADHAPGFEPAEADPSIHGCVDTPLGARGLRETRDAALHPRMAAARAFGFVPGRDRFTGAVAAAPPGPHLHPLALSPVLIL